MITTLISLVFLAQNFEQRGFIENRELFYPQTVQRDPGRIIDQAEFQWEPTVKVENWFKWKATYDFRMDTHQQVERSLWPDIDDRSTKRPGFSIREFYVSLHKGNFTGEIGRQTIRWGKTDILNPTDRFAPKDYVSSVVHPDTL